MAKTSNSLGSVALSDAASLQTARGRIGHAKTCEHIIDARHSRLNFLRQALASRSIVRKDTGIEAIVRIVRQPQSLGFISDAHNRQNRPERLISHDLH